MNEYKVCACKSGIRGGWLTLNRRCNLRCKWCYTSRKLIDGGDMPLKLAQELIDLMSTVGVRSVVLIGGEPTLYPNVIDLIEKVVEVGMRPVIISNGIRFADRDLCSLLFERGLKDVTISMKGVSREQYIRLTNSDSFEKICKGVDNLRAIGLEPMFEFTVAREHLAEIEWVIRDLVAMGVRNLSIDLASPVIDGLNVGAASIPDPFELRDVVHRIHACTDTSILDYVIYLTIPFCIVEDAILRDLILHDRLVSGCHISHGSALIFDETGQILPCNHMTGLPIGKWGQDFKNSNEFLQYWNSHDLIDFRSSCSCYPAKSCVECGYWDKCGGGCMIKWLYWKPDDYIPKYFNHNKRKEVI